MGIFQIVIFGILAMVLALLIKNYNSALAMLVSLGAGVLIFIAILPLLAEALGFARYLGELADGAGQYTSLALRVIGVAYIAEFGTSVCNDANETAIAAKIDLAARVIILILAFPVIIDIVRIVTGLLP
ncbi:MAG: stage III sporulation protein AD [Defluviitaleaceae bacterium]|nr:stage III sporulation protein AD [Defluviitaleaceae bacterium]